MPLYDYVCARCSKNFEELVLEASATPACPSCAEPDEVTRVRFAKLTLGKKENLSPPFIKGVRPPRR
jgi:putative FmdB family regulatory protein